MCFWKERQKISFSLKPVSSQHSSSLLRMFGLMYIFCIYIYFNCNLPIGMGEDLLGEHEIQDKILRYCTCGLWSILMVNTQMGQLGMLPISYKTASWWKNTHTDNFPPSSLHPLSKHSFKDLRPLSLPLPRRSSRDVNSPAPVDCQLSQWSGWTDCFPCQEKKVRIHCNVFIYLQMCLWWGCTHINYIYYTYSSFWSIQ